MLGDYTYKGWEKFLAEGLVYKFNNDDPRASVFPHLQPMGGPDWIVPTPDYRSRWKQIGDGEVPEAWSDDGQMEWRDQFHTGMLPYQQIPYKVRPRVMPKQTDKDYANLAHRVQREANTHYTKLALKEIHAAKSADDGHRSKRPEGAVTEAQLDRERAERGITHNRETLRQEARKTHQGSFGTVRSKSAARHS